MSEKIAVNVTFTVNNGELEAVKPLLQTLSTKTHAEKGCIHYNFLAAIDDPEKIFVHELWENMAALDAHLQSEHFKEIIPQLMKHTSPAVISKCHQWI